MKKKIKKIKDGMMETAIWLAVLIVVELVKFKAAYHVLQGIGWFNGGSLLD